MHLLVAHAETFLHELVGLADELHIAILDAVVGHLDVVAGAVLAHPVATRSAVIHLGGNRLEDFLDQGPGLVAAAGHDGRAVTRAFLAAGDAGADEEHSLTLQVLGSPDGVREVGVAAVDDEVASLEMGQHRLDEIVHCLPGLDHEHDLAGPLQHADHLFDRMCSHDTLVAVGRIVQEIVDLGYGAVVSHHCVAVVGHVEDQVLAHHRQTDKCNIAFRFHIDATPFEIVRCMI